jgi:hypothetical protein
MRQFVIAGVCSATVLTAAFAEEANPAVVLNQELKSQAPSQWQIRTRWQGDQLVASVAPLPYQDAFELWYQPAKLLQTLRDLCPKPTEPVWSLIGPEQDIVLEPSIGGKSAAEARINCPRHAEPTH